MTIELMQSYKKRMKNQRIIENKAKKGLSGQLNDETATVVIAGIKGDGTAHLQHMILSERQSQTKTLGEVVRFSEWLEDMVAISFWNTFTCIHKDVLDGIVCQSNMQLDMLPVRVFCRVIENLAQTVQQVGTVGLNTEIVGYFCIEFDV